MENLIITSPKDDWQIDDQIYEPADKHPLLTTTSSGLYILGTALRMFLGISLWIIGALIICAFAFLKLWASATRI